MTQKKSKPDVLQQDMAALERAVLKLARYNDDNMLHGMVNCILQGWIKNGKFTEEYKEAARQAEINRRESEAAEARAAAVRSSILGTTSSTGGITSR